MGGEEFRIPVSGKSGYHYNHFITVLQVDSRQFQQKDVRHGRRSYASGR